MGSWRRGCFVEDGKVLLSRRFIINKHMTLITFVVM